MNVYKTWLQMPQYKTNNSETTLINLRYNHAFINLRIPFNLKIIIHHNLN